MMASPTPSAQSIHFLPLPKPPDRRDTLAANEYRYIGEYNADNQRHGFGRAFFKTGDSYEGYYENGKRHGHGMYRFMNGAVYDGQWVNGMKNGLGVFTYPDGSKYEGYWLDDQRSDHGVYTYVNGDRYDGHWRYHVRHGSGRYIYVHAGLQYQGTWNDGKREGIGHLLDYETKEVLQGAHPSTDSVKSDQETDEQHEKHVQEQRRQTEHFLQLDKRYGHEKLQYHGDGSTSDAGSTRASSTGDGPTEEIPKDVLIPGGEGATEGEGRAEWWDAQKPSQQEEVLVPSSEEATEAEGQATWLEEQVAVPRQQEEVLVPGGEAVTEAEGRAAWWEAQGQRQQEGMESQHDAQSQHDDAQGQPDMEGHQNVQGPSATDHEHRSEGHEDEGQNDEKDEHVTESHDYHSQQDLTEGNKDQNEGQQNEGNKDQTESHQNEGHGHPHCEGLHVEGQLNCDAKGCSITRKCPFETERSIPVKDEGSFYDLLSSSIVAIGSGGADDNSHPTKDPATDQGDEHQKDFPDAAQLGIELQQQQIPRNESDNSEPSK